MLKQHKYRIVLRFEVTKRTHSKERGEKLAGKQAISAAKIIRHFFRRFLNPSFEVVYLGKERVP